MTTPLPVVVKPLSEESLLGYLARLIRVNSIGFGPLRISIAAHRTALYPASFTLGTLFALDRLAALTMESREAIERLTFLPELRRLYQTQTPSAKLLGRVSLAVCPLCWRDAPMHRKHHLLPGIEACGVHGVALRTTCDCGEALGISDRSLGECRRCGLSWAHLDARPLAPDALGRNRRVISAYRSVLGEPDIPTALSRLREVRDGHRRATGESLPLWLQAISLERLVGLHVALGTDREVIEAMHDRGNTPCPNAACPNHDLEGAAAKQVESHCRLCGTRFKGARILSTFDLDHGQDRPSVTQVRRARRRLAGWRRALRVVCAELLWSGEPVTVERAFPAAGVPLNANLRAPRLGLTSIVRAAEARRQDVAAPWRYGLQGRPRSAVARHERLVLLDWLTKAVDAGDVPPSLRSELPQRHDPGEWLRVWQ